MEIRAERPVEALQQCERVLQEHPRSSLALGLKSQALRYSFSGD
jgi:hypothetical protein